jgi:hypothetical protein
MPPKQPFTFRAFEKSVSLVSFANDSRTLTTVGSNDGYYIKTWRTATDEEVAKYQSRP